MVQCFMLVGATIAGIIALISWYTGWATLTIMVPFRYCTKPRRSTNPNKNTVEMIEKNLEKEKKN